MQKCIYVFLLLICMIIAGCNHSTEGNLIENSIFIDDEVEIVNSNSDIYDFLFIDEAPVATAKHDLDEIIKLYFSTNSPLTTRIAIDIKNNEIYKKPRYVTTGVFSSKEPILFDDKTTLVNILDKYNIQDWKEDYTSEDPDSYQDGAGWTLILQFEDGTIEEHGGHGTTDAIFPKEFDGFVEDIDLLVKEILGEDYRKRFQ